MASKIRFAEVNAANIGITPRNFAYLQYEKYIQRTFYPCIIHPYSRFRILWERISAWNILLRLTIICFVWAALNHSNIIYQLIALSFQLVTIVDIILNFFTGYVIRSSDFVVFEPMKIALNYLKGRFVFDLTAALPFDIFFYYLDRTYGLHNYSSLCWLASPSCFWCSLGRFPTFAVYMFNSGRILLWDHLYMGMILICAVLYLGVLFSTNLCLCQVGEIMESFNPLTGTDRLTKYFDTALLIILNSLFYEIVFPVENNFVRWLALNISLVGNTMFMAYFINYVIMRMKNDEKFMAIEYQVRTFVSLRQFNSALKNKTLLYFEILLENRFTKDEEIFNYIPETFKGDIFYHLLLPLLKNFFCFEDLPTFVLRRLAESMDYQLYLPNELVMSKEETVLRLYFVQRGTVALYSAKDVELYHFEAGSNFNGTHLILGELKSTTYAISIEVAELYRLTYDDFRDIMSEYPKLYESMLDKVRLGRKDSTYFQ